jgi:hypothetical protein
VTAKLHKRESSPEEDKLASKHVAAINKEQYNKLSIKCAFVCFIIHTAKDARYKG